MQQLSDFYQGQTLVVKIDHDVEHEAPRIEQMGNYWELGSSAYSELDFVFFVHIMFWVLCGIMSFVGSFYTFS